MKNKTNSYALAGVFVFLALVVFGPAAAKKYDSEKAWIGVYTQTIDKDLQEAFDLEGDQGVVVVDVVDDSPADEAGLRRKDIITKFNGEGDELADYVSDMKVGDKAEIVILRNGREKVLEVEVEQRPQSERPGSRSGSFFTIPKIITHGNSFSSYGNGYIGVSIQDLSDQLGKYFGVEAGEGILITDVFEDSPAEKAGLKAGDVIVSVDDEAVVETDELRDIISEKEEGDTVTIGYLRKGNKEKAVVEVTEETHGMSSFSMPNLNIRIPNLSGLKNLDHFYFSDDDQDYFDVKEYKKEMEELKRELMEMGKELKEIKLKLE